MPSKVAILRTAPQSVLADVREVMRLGGAKAALDPAATTILKNNISWHLMFPGANTTPWQLEGVIQGLHDAGLNDLVVVENETVVTSAAKGELLNKQRVVAEHYHVPIKYNFKPADMTWTLYEPRSPMGVLNQIFPKGIRIPDYFIGKNVLHLPTIKCHIYTNATGAMKNAFGGLLANNRHYCHSRIHETLVDLLAIQKEIHPGIFAVVDGTTAGNGPGPRTMIPVTKNTLLASDDCVAIDAVACKLMGFDPMAQPYIRLAHERGLGVGRIEEIEIVGDLELAKQNWGFHTGCNAAGSVGRLLWQSPLKSLQRLLFHTPLVNLFILGSAIYHDSFWYPLKGKPICREWLTNSPWGQLFTNFAPGKN